MKTINGEKFCRIGEVAKEINRSAQTIKHWYKWAEESGNTNVLPKVFRLDSRGTRYFRLEDVPKLAEFAENIEYGQMSDYNSKLWGERGQLIRERGKQRFTEQS